MVGSTFGFVELLEKWGIERRVSKAGECKTGVDPFLPVDPAARQRQQTLLDDLHAEFIPQEVQAEIARSWKLGRKSREQPWDKNATPAEPPGPLASSSRLETPCPGCSR